MNQDIYLMLQALQTHMNKQEQTIRHLQKELKSLEKKINQLENRPPVHVERMEYKFDQLKVETLEGTLNIGLNPSDLQGIEDFAVPSQKDALSPQDRTSLFSEVDQSIQQHLDTNLNKVIHDTAQTLNIQMHQEYENFILQDVKKQLPSRIEYYLNQPLRREYQNREQQIDWIVEQLKKEVQQGVSVFLRNLPENMKGPNAE